MQAARARAAATLSVAAQAVQAEEAGSCLVAAVAEVTAASEVTAATELTALAVERAATAVSVPTSVAAGLVGLAAMAVAVGSAVWEEHQARAAVAGYSGRQDRAARKEDPVSVVPEGTAVPEGLVAKAPLEAAPVNRVRQAASRPTPILARAVLEGLVEQVVPAPSGPRLCRATCHGYAVMARYIWAAISPLLIISAM